MKTKTLTPGDEVKLKTKSKVWQGHILGSHEQGIILLKLKSGYNIGVRESEVLDVTIIKKANEAKKEDIVLEKNPKLRNVALVITGGTISSRLDPKTGAALSTGAEEILKIAPELHNTCNITKIEKPFLKSSEDMSWADWKKLAVITEKLLNDEAIDGVIITHGTDFLHYSAAALSFFLKDVNKPVAFTYSQRSVDRASTDASLNLLCAAKYAVSDIAEVALVGHEDGNDIACQAMPGTRTRKMHTSVRGAFKILNAEPLARITLDNFDILQEFNARDTKRKVSLDASYDADVALVRINPGQDPDILNYYASQGYKGIILELTGLGHVPAKGGKHNWLPTIKKIIARGIPIFGTAQTIFGTLNPNVYSPGRDLQKTGLVFLNDMTSETALVKLGWVLGHKKWAKDIELVKAKMLENISGEISS